MYLEPSILTLNESLQVVPGRGIHMEVVAFVGSSGTGKSHRALVTKCVRPPLP